MTDLFSEFERDVRAYNPFEGDFGDPGDRDLSDKMVTAAKPHCECHNCGGPIEKGERPRHKVSILDGELFAWRWCWACCVAMAKVWLPDDADEKEAPWREIEDRFGLRMTRDANDSTAGNEGEAEVTKTTPQRAA